MWLSFGINRMQARHGTGAVLDLCAVMGLSLASVFLVFTGESIARDVLHHRRDLRGD